MTEAQKQHLVHLLNKFDEMATSKYEAGAAEHGGNLWEKGILFLLDQAIAENIDQFIYLMTMRDEIMKIKGLLPEPTAIDIDKRA